MRKKITAVLTALAMTASLIPAAFGDNATATITIAYKSDATISESDVSGYIADNDGSSLTISSCTFSGTAGASTPAETCSVTYSDGTTTDYTITYSAISATSYAFVTNPLTLPATSSYNTSSNTLLNYVNLSENQQVAGSSSSYTSALGTAPTYTYGAVFTWGNNTYAAAGGSYGFTSSAISVNGVTCSLTRTLTVSPGTLPAPPVWIDYNGCTVSTNTSMQYSLDERTWTKCTAGMAIPSAWYAKVVYFRYTPTIYASNTFVQSLYIPKKAAAPTTALAITTTSHSVTINNCWSYDNCEYSINGGASWYTTSKSSYTFDNLTPATSYSVKVRVYGVEGKWLPSTVKSATAKTASAVSTKYNVTYEGSGTTGTVTYTATVAPEVWYTTVTGSLSADELKRFQDIVATFADKYYTVKSSMLITHKAEKYEPNNIGAYNFTVPLSSLDKAITNGRLTLKYTTDFGSIYLSNNALRYYKGRANGWTLSLNMTKITSINGSNYNWLKSELTNGRPVYRLSVTAGSYSEGSIKYIIPYELTADDTINSIGVYNVNTSGKITLVDSTYDPSAGTITFTSSLTNYFVITDTGNDALANIHFTDVPSTYWAYKHIRYCYTMGYMTGTTAATFDVKSDVTRGMIYLILSRMDGYSYTPSSVITRKFSDVAVDAWYAPGAYWAYEKGYVTTPAFSPSGTMTRKDIAVLLNAYLTYRGVSPGTSDTGLGFEDISELTNEQKTAIACLCDLGIMTGTSEATFDPSGNVTRPQLAAIIYRASLLM